MQIHKFKGGSSNYRPLQGQLRQILKFVSDPQSTDHYKGNQCKSSNTRVDPQITDHSKGNWDKSSISGVNPQLIDHYKSNQCQSSNSRVDPQITDHFKGNWDKSSNLGVNPYLILSSSFTWGTALHRRRSLIVQHLHPGIGILLHPTTILNILLKHIYFINPLS